MALYKGYFDDSGHETRNLLISAGLVIDIADSQAFNAEWVKAIAPLPYLHMKDFITGNGPYAEWKGRYAEKVVILSKAAQTIANFSFQTFSVALDMADYRKADAEFGVSECIGYPFTTCVRFSDVQLNQWAASHRIPDRIELVVERREEGQGDVCEVFARDEIPEPSFEGKNLCPLQAADFLAWMYNGKLARLDNFYRVRSALDNIPACLHTHDYITYSTMRAICKRSLEKACFEIPRRNELNGPVAFHNSPKRNRRKFAK